VKKILILIIWAIFSAAYKMAPDRVERWGRELKGAGRGEKKKH
jgi:hypothetical protein